MATATTTTTKAAPPAHKVVNANLNYYLDPSKGGHETYRIGVAEYYRYKYEVHAAQVHDIRGREDQFSLKTNGFQHHRHVSAEKDFTDDEQIKQVVYPETVKLLKDVYDLLFRSTGISVRIRAAHDYLFALSNSTGATRVHIYSHLIRKESRDEAEAAAANDPTLKDNNAPFQKVVPGRFIHIDFSEDGAYEMFHDNLEPELAQRLSKTRWSLINVWRPIKPISKDPLAMCDARSARDEDLKRVVALLPSKGDGQYADFSSGARFEMFVKAHHPGERWYYADKMTPEEVYLIKCFDTVHDGETARRCPHTAFVDPETVNDVTRESIEVRALVFFEDQPV